MPTRYDTELGRRVTRLLVDACSTQAALANRLDLSRQHVNQMITGRRRADDGFIEKVQKVLGEKNGSPS